MYNDLKQLKKMKGLTDGVKRRIEKAWVWGLITDEQFEELAEIVKESEEPEVTEGTEEPVAEETVTEETVAEETVTEETVTEDPATTA